jgi:SAM-dependent methyltransferase
VTTQTSPRPSKLDVASRQSLSSIRQLYDGPAGAFLAVSGVLTGHDLLAGRVINPDGFDVRGRKRLLDAACGNGRYSRHLLRHADADATITAYDLSHGMLKRARKSLASDRVRYVQADATRLPFADGSFDAAVLGYALEHFVDPRPALSEMARVLAPDGKLLLLTTEDTLLGGMVKLVYKIRTYDRQELRTACEECGLSWGRELWFSGLHRRLGMGGVVVELRRQGGANG